MNIVFVSNFLNHHQIPLCRSLSALCETFYFVATDIYGSQGFQTSKHDTYVIDWSTEKRRAEQLILDADAVIFGACPNELIALRMGEEKLSFLFSERFFKKGTWRRWIPSTRQKITGRIVQYKDAPIYILCASAYLPYDLSLFSFPKEKFIKWGYFPEAKRFGDAVKWFQKKEPHSILWCGRLIDWKHPELAVKTAKKLMDHRVPFHMDIIGSGPMDNQLRKLIAKYRLTDCVRLVGAMEPEEVRNHMERSEVFLFTSDRREGWGAVLNESMNSGCAVVASHAIGAVPYLMRHEENGLIYHSGDVDTLFGSVKYLLDNPKEQERMGIAACETIVNQWNAEVAAQRLVKLSEQLLTGEKYPDLYVEGPCSQAGIVRDNWFSY